ncbi:MAG: alpha-amylase family glycosyl hydrolase [Ferruginibacter sp.]
MRYIAAILFCCVYLFSSAKSLEKAIVVNKSNATVWLEKQTITGRTRGFFTDQLIVICNKISFKVFVKKNHFFSFVVTLQKGENKIHLKTVTGKILTSDTLKLSLGFNPEPVIKPYAINEGERLALHMQIIRNPSNERLNFLWYDDPRNPFPCNVKNRNDSVAFIKLPPPNGTYYFNLQVSTSTGRVRFQTFVTRDTLGIHIFNIDTGHAAWIDDAIIYEITPSVFVKNGSYDDIATKLEEISQLGINTIWLQPVFSSFYKGQGYDVTDYFSLRKDLGTEAQLKSLIIKAKQLHLKVLFDFVPNHTSIHHPYAQDCIKYGTKSHYYKFYQHQSDTTAYSSFYKKNAQGFITYFWEDLVNLDYNNEEVQQWITEACKYWVRKFDIDGYRFDAVWAVNARNPSFSKKLTTALKCIKPDLLLLAEDKGSVADTYGAGFDAAYDWTSDRSWISHWSWQYEYAPRKNLTLFAYPDVSKRPGLLTQALFDNGHVSNLRLRFIENNDLPGFIRDHNLICTRMAAALLFSLPGIPMIYNGQEIGSKRDLYSDEPIFETMKSIHSLDSIQLFGFYKKLIRVRKKYPALCGTNMNSLSVYPAGKMVAFRRWKNEEDIIVVLNMDSVAAEATIDIRNILTRHPQNGVPGFEDLLTDTVFETDDPSKIKIPMSGYGIRWLLVNNPRRVEVGK